MNTAQRKGMGAIRNLPDNRNIRVAKVAASRGIEVTAHTKKNITDISMLPFEDQERLGTCVGQSEGKGQEYREFRETGEVFDLSKRFIYKRCKDQDGLAGEGTYPIVAAKVLTNEGTPREDFLEDNNGLSHEEYLDVTITPAIRTDASLRRTKGYAFAMTLDEIKTAIDIEGVMNGTLIVGDWSKLPVKPFNSKGQNEGLHRVLFYGYEDKKNGKRDDTKIYFRNSWGKDWAKGANAADRALLKEGNGWFWWSEYQGFLFDLMVYTDMPNELIDYAKETEYQFTRDLEEGMSGTDVTELQKRLSRETALDGVPCFRYPFVNATPQFTAFYGRYTREAVERYQCREGIVCSGTAKSTGYGRLGPSTRARMNGEKARAGLYPAVQERIDLLVAIMDAVGSPVVVTGDYRTTEEQDALYAKGRTEPGPIVTNARGGESMHNWRCAADLAFKKGTGITYDGPWEKLGKVGKLLGLEWGGDWTSFEDKPHFQYTAGYMLSDFQQGRIDESRFGVDPSRSEGGDELAANTNETMKRIKSGLIVFGSSLFAGFLMVIPTVEFANFVQWLGAVAAELGVPGVVWALLVGIVSQAWMAWRNQANLHKYEQGRWEAGVAARGREYPDLY